MDRTQFLRPLLCTTAALAALLGATPATSQPAAPEPPPAMASAEAAFRRADTNADNRLSKAEAESLPAIAARFAELDKDKDGFLSMAEFLSAFAPRP